MGLEHLQIYWWLLISVLGALLVFLLFVQGGQSMILCTRNPMERNLIINSIGKKWELTFTTLVVFGGAFFASFPLFYSTSFGGAYWLWMLILFTFVGQAVSFQYRRKAGNLYGTSFYDWLLMINGVLGCFLLGVAVSMFFFGAEFSVKMGNILDSGSPVISRWAPTHGFEAIFCWKNWILGIAVVFLARMQAALYFMNNVGDDDHFFRLNKRRVLVNGVIFVVFFLVFVGMLLMADGYRTTGAHSFLQESNRYLLNFIEMWWCLVLFLVGVVMVLYAVFRSSVSDHYTKGIWWSGIGTFIVVLSLFFVAGYNDTPYYPSLTDPSSSLTIQNSSSTYFTLKVMSFVSILIPVVVAYIAYVWYKMDRGQFTPEEMESDSHSY
ncbi:cytochrome d ubiquinol oxidase subunit II [Barnesiella sp. WM24]|uniref:cytochrome d ubiquinol oxidase subunit II n=1 Tax=Barnesiella sp. WM24 TaxID=2558278 RepID=UPI000B0447C0|nr:cytochrome d ubiquinol oxidase subunit II [Barnesiella sp. WM24]MDE6113442.1 cytochrome d ubiquinol oxidase subunit II [Muribaculum sp.]TFU92776.1 cytochrome d ubiquinol oxidase subunit II [Barnesiella sp. WM24]